MLFLRGEFNICAHAHTHTPNKQSHIFMFFHTFSHRCFCSTHNLRIGLHAQQKKLKKQVSLIYWF